MLCGTYHASPTVGIEVSETLPLGKPPCYRVEFFNTEEGAFLGSLILTDADLQSLISSTGWVLLED